ncbi:MAG: hypothetical protein SV775_01120, partial [Thermodesulfobacteriota bacterium]|nr:hypothetical protein [Thermodesulfobacteriota bacterium]
SDAIQCVNPESDFYNMGLLTDKRPLWVTMDDVNSVPPEADPDIADSTTHCDGVDNDADDATDEDGSEEVCDGADNDGNDGIDEEGGICMTCNEPGALGYNNQALDEDCDGLIDEDGKRSHAGWFFDFPIPGERMVQRALIRQGKKGANVLIALSFIPNDSPCSGGGDSFLNEINADTGGNLGYEVFDINDDDQITGAEYDEEGNLVDPGDTINFGTVDQPDCIAPSRLRFPGMLYTPYVPPTESSNTTSKYTSTSMGVVLRILNHAEPLGMFYWLER